MPAGESLQDEEDETDDEKRNPQRKRRDTQNWKKQGRQAPFPPTRYPRKINLNDCLKSSPDQEKKTSRRGKKLQRASIRKRGKRQRRKSQRLSLSAQKKRYGAEAGQYLGAIIQRRWTRGG